MVYQNYERVQENPLKFPKWRMEKSLLLKHGRSDPGSDYPQLSEKSEDWKVVVPKDNMAEILLQNHDDCTSGHMGIYIRHMRDSKLNITGRR